MTKRQEFYLENVLGFAKFTDDYIKTDFIRIGQLDYARIIAVKEFPDGEMKAKVQYSRAYDDEDPTPVDPFIDEETKKNDKYVAIFIVQTLKTEWMKSEGGNK